MFTQILHHTYKLNGDAVDVSGNETHGQRTDTQHVTDGRSTETGALEYIQPSSDVTVPAAPVWDRLRALKLELWVKLDELGQRRNLIEGDRCFAFYIQPDGTLIGTIYAPARAGADPTWHGANSDDDSPDGTTRTVPTDEWVRLSYLHDGVSTLQLYVDGELVAVNNDMYAGVGSVQPKGVQIGHWVGDGRYTFSGLIDDVKVWKYDPESGLEQFFCRPLNSEQRACWKRIFDRMGDAAENPDRSTALIKTIHCIWQEVERLIREVRSQGVAARQTQREFVSRYQDLWCCGAIAGPAMRNLLEEWFAWLAEVVGEARIWEFQDTVWACYQEYEADEWLQSEDDPGLAECDPEFVSYLDLVHDVFGGPNEPDS